MYKNEHDANVHGFRCCAGTGKVGTTSTSGTTSARRTFANKVALLCVLIGFFFFFVGLAHVLQHKESFDLSCVVLGGFFWAVGVLIGVTK